MPSPGPRAAVLPSTLPLEQQGIILANLGTLLGTDHPSFRSLEQAMAFYAMWQVKRKDLGGASHRGREESLFPFSWPSSFGGAKFVVVSLCPSRGLLLI